MNLKKPAITFCFLAAAVTATSFVEPTLATDNCRIDSRLQVGCNPKILDGGPKISG